MFFTISGALLTFAVSTFLFYKASGTLSLTKLNIISFSYYMLILQVFLGVMLISFGFDKHYTLEYLIYRNYSITMMINAVAVTMIVLPIVVIATNKIFKFNPHHEFNDFLYREVDRGKSNGIYFLIIAIFFIQIILLIGLIIKTKYVPLIKLFVHEDCFDFALARQINQNEIFIINQYVKNIIVLFGIPIMGYITFAYAMIEKKIKWIVLASIYFFAGIITKTYSFAKAPLIWYLFIYFLIFCYVKHEKIKNYMIISFGAIMATIIMIFYRLEGFKGSFFDLYNGFIGRTIFSQVGALAYHFDLFPNIFDFLHGRSLSPILLIVLGKDPKLHLRSAKLIMDFYGSAHVYEGTAGVQNAFFLGEAYANWGVIGMAFAVVYVGIFLSLNFILIMKIKKTPVTIAMLAIVTNTLGNVLQGGFTDFIYNFSIWLTVMGCLFLIYFDDIINWILMQFRKTI